MAQTTVFNVEMACGGCSGACTRILTKMGVASVDANLEKQTVTVTYDETPDLTPETMLAALKKWGESAKKSVELKQ